jgi:RNA polymerase sigma-70 factor (ECF subfamily)
MVELEELAISLIPAGVSLAAGRAMIGETDQAVVERVLRGDIDAFSVLVDRYQDRIYSVVLSYVSNPEDAVDVAQDAFIKSYSKLRSFDSASAFYTWLYRIAINTAIDFLRKRKSRFAESLDDEKFTEAGFEPESKDPSLDPESVATRKEQAHILRAAISKLSDKLRTVVVLHDVEGLSQEEVAAILRVPVGTVKSRVSRARVELRYTLRKLMGEAV